MIDVSVVVPVYNVEKWLPDCLDSILAQTLENIEVICVNDASPDGCAAILEDYAARDNRIRVVTLERNSGQGIARNEGLARAKGRYVYFLDSDDMVEPNALEVLVARADADDLEGIVFDSRVIYETPKLAKRFKSTYGIHIGTYDKGVMKGLDLFEAFVNQYDWTCYVQWQMWRRDYLHENGIKFPDSSLHEDEQFAFEVLVRASRVAFLPEPFFIRRYREGSIMTSKKGVRSLIAYFKTLYLMLKTQKELGLSDNTAVNSNIARICFSFKRIYAKLRQEGENLDLTFDDEAMQNAFRLLSFTQDSSLYNRILSPYVIEQVAASDKLYIYGAGDIAGDSCDILSAMGYAVDGFIVTSLNNNARVFKGHRVYEVTQLPSDPDALVLVAVTDGFRDEVEACLAEAGWRFVYCKEGRNS